MIQGARTPVPLDLIRLAGGDHGRVRGGIGRVIADSFVSFAAARCSSPTSMKRGLAACGHRGMRADAGKARRHGGVHGRGDQPSSAGSTCWSTMPGSPGPTAAGGETSTRRRWMRRCRSISPPCSIVPGKRRAGAAGRPGAARIVNLSSAAGKFGFPLRSPYAAAKWGVVGFTRTLAMELGPDGIRVNAILPGPGRWDRAIRKRDARNKAAAAGSER